MKDEWIELKLEFLQRHWNGATHVTTEMYMRQVSFCAELANFPDRHPFIDRKYYDILSIELLLNYQ